MLPRPFAVGSVLLVYTLSLGMLTTKLANFNNIMWCRVLVYVCYDENRYRKSF